MNTKIMSNNQSPEQDFDSLSNISSSDEVELNLKDLPTLAITKDLLAGLIPIIDVRAPIEFAKGSLAGSVNLPLMTNEERHLVGTCYKQKGHNAAVALGHQLVSGQVKAERLAQWRLFIEAHPNAVVMCFRGGLRSRLTQSWLKESGLNIPRIEGGYKALRNAALDLLDNPFEPFGQKSYLIGGHTGAGKTPFIQSLDGHIDLEGLALHRGSAFGGFLDPQPSQVTFENALAAALVRTQLKGYRHLFFEHESRAIGRVMIPNNFMAHLNASPLIVLLSDLEERVTRTCKEYVFDAALDYKRHGLDFSDLQQDLIGKLMRIKKRLGLERTLEVVNMLNEACALGDPHQLNTPTEHVQLIEDRHKVWVRTLLGDYYDPMYAYQRDQWQNSVLFEGDAAGIRLFIQGLD